MMKLKIDYEINVTEEDIEDIVVTALEGGIGYWCCLDNTEKEFENAPEDEPISITASKILLSGGKIFLIDEVENERYSMSLNDLLDGIKEWVSEGLDHYNAISTGGIDCCNIDSACADSIFQCALFGGIEYA